MYCPNCGFQVERIALECPRCTASFSSESSWKPVAEKPAHVLEFERIASTPASLSLAFSGKVLALSVLLGPLVAVVGMGMRIRDISDHPKVLLPIYTVGAPVAIVSWLLFSLAFALVQSWQQRASRKPASFGTGVLLGAGFGATSGFVAWALFTCSASAWGVGGWIPCLKANVLHYYAFSLVPGIVCGVAAVLLWGRRGA